MVPGHNFSYLPFIYTSSHSSFLSLSYFSLEQISRSRISRFALYTCPVSRQRPISKHRSSFNARVVDRRVFYRRSLSITCNLVYLFVHLFISIVVSDSSS